MPDPHDEAALAWLLRRLGDPLTDPVRRDHIAMCLLRLARPNAGAADGTELRLMEDAGAAILGKLARLKSAEME